jgi:hypothetical protein
MLIFEDIIHHSKIYGSTEIDEVSSWVALRNKKLSLEETVHIVAASDILRHCCLRNKAPVRGKCNIDTLLFTAKAVSYSYSENNVKDL